MVILMLNQNKYMPVIVLCVRILYFIYEAHMLSFYEIHVLLLQNLAI